MTVLSFSIRNPGGKPFIITTTEGRVIWALDELIAAGPRGCTPTDNPAPRWSSYVHKLRKAGVDIETVHEPHEGPFPGHHGRYILKAHVERVKGGAA